MGSVQSYILQIDRIRFLVFMPRGHTIVHLPQSIQHRSICRTSCPRCTARRIFLTLIPERAPAGQVALQEPHPMQVRAPLSRRHSSSNRRLSTFARSRVELLLSVKPKSVIAFPDMSEWQVRRCGLQPPFRVLSSDLCRSRRRRCRDDWIR